MRKSGQSTGPRVVIEHDCILPAQDLYITQIPDIRGVSNFCFLRIDCLNVCEPGPWSRPRKLVPLQCHAMLAEVDDDNVQVVSMQKVQPEGEDDDLSFASPATAPQVHPRLTSAAMRANAQASEAQPVAGSRQGSMDSTRVWRSADALNCSPGNLWHGIGSAHVTSS